MVNLTFVRLRSAKMPENLEERKKWMSHYWEAAATDKGNKKLTEEAIVLRIADLAQEIAQRREAMRACSSLVEEMHWRERQLDMLRGA